MSSAARVRKIIQSLVDQEERVTGCSEPVIPHWTRLKDAEKLFLDRAIHRHDVRVYRNGWPDFAIQDRNTGEVKFVEVKWGGDRLRVEQKQIAELLTSLSLKVYVWTPAEPDKLVPWHKF